MLLHEVGGGGLDYINKSKIYEVLKFNILDLKLDLLKSKTIENKIKSTVMMRIE